MKIFSPGKRQLLSILVIVFIALFYFSQLEDGHGWGDDFSMYIMHAQNIVQGKPYAQTNYLYNPDTAFYGPQAYPPVFPLLLAPVLAVWGIQFKLLKLIGVICFVLFLYVFDRHILPKDMLPGFRLAFLIFVGLYPEYLALSNNLLSDLPFLLFSTLALVSVNAYLDTRKFAQLRWWQPLIAGIFVYLAYGTRSIGLILLPLVLVFDLVQNRRITSRSIFIILIAGSLIVLQNFLIPGTGSYADQIRKSTGEAIDFALATFAYYILLLPTIVPFDSSTLQTAVLLGMMAVALFGFLGRVQNGVSIFELFFVIYLVSIILVPSLQGIRFLLPVIPLYFFYLIVGVERIALSFPRLSWLPHAAALLLLCAVLGYYANWYRNMLPMKSDVFAKSETRQLLEFVRQATAPEDVIAFSKPRALGLFTDRKSVAVAIPDPNGDIFGRLQTLSVDYVIVQRKNPVEFQPQWMQLIAENPGKFNLIFENAEFKIYRIDTVNAFSLAPQIGVSLLVNHLIPLAVVL